MELLKRLKSWLNKPGNSEAKLAVLLGYRDAAPIKAWVRRESIPSFRREQLTKIIVKAKKGEKKK